MSSGRLGTKSNHGEGDRVEHESRSQQALLREAFGQAAELGRGQRGGQGGAGEDRPDNVGRRVEARVHQDRQVRNLRAEQHDESQQRSTDQAKNLPVAQVLLDAPEVVLQPVVVARLGVVQREQNHNSNRYRQKRKGERVEPPEGREQAAGRGIARRPDGEAAGVVPQRTRALTPLAYVTYNRYVQGPEGGPHTLKKAEREEDIEAAGESAGPSGKAKKQERGNQDLLPPVPVGEHTENRRHHDTRQGEERDQKPYLTTRNAKLLHDGRKRRRYTRRPQNRHQRNAPQHLKKVVVLVDRPNALVFSGLRGHSQRIYQRFSISALQ
jgi:hypothetical protein